MIDPRGPKPCVGAQPCQCVGPPLGEQTNAKGAMLSIGTGARPRHKCILQALMQGSGGRGGFRARGMVTNCHWVGGARDWGQSNWSKMASLPIVCPPPVPKVHECFGPPSPGLPLAPEPPPQPCRPRACLPPTPCPEPPPTLVANRTSAQAPTPCPEPPPTLVANRTSAQAHKARKGPHNGAQRHEYRMSRKARLVTNSHVDPH